MKITVIGVGKIKEKYFTDAIKEYAKRLSRYCKLEIVEVADEKTPDGASETLNAQIKEKEGVRILQKIPELHSSSLHTSCNARGRMRSNRGFTSG